MDGFHLKRGMTHENSKSPNLLSCDMGNMNLDSILLGSFWDFIDHSIWFISFNDVEMENGRKAIVDISFENRFEPEHDSNNQFNDLKQ
jgi:hypothetical protein